jgi:hypothetical protein
MDYSNIGLNQYLQPVKAPVTQVNPIMDGFSFDSNYERGVVTGAKLGNFSFNAGTGGTISLGGTLNGNGYLEVKDSSGSVIVNVNNNGITVTGGSVSIKNSAGTTILDGTGLVSGASFASDGTVDSSGRTTQSSSPVDLSNTSLTFTLSRQAKVFLNFLAVAGFNPIDTNDVMAGNVFMNIDGADDSFPPGMYAGAVFTASSFVNSSIKETLAYSQIKTLSAGSHTIKLRFNCSGVTGTDKFEVTQTSVMYIVLGT